MKRNSLVVLLLVAATVAVAEQIVPLSTLDLNMVEQDSGRARANRSVDNKPMSIAGETFTNGFGTHAFSQLILDVHGNAERFSALAGIDDEIAKGGGTVRFEVVGDDRLLWRSSWMHSGDKARKIDISVRGIKHLVLMVNTGADGNDGDHADWANAVITMNEGMPVPMLAPRELAVILTPKASPKPRINSAKVFGVRPGHPFLFTVAATGDRPMTFSADDLPEGLKLDAETGHITGALDVGNSYMVTLHAKNALGEATQKFKIICGPQIGLTPAMGWNSWNCFGASVTADDVKKAADAMAGSGLINHGWTYINVDDYWEVKPTATNDPTLQGPQRDASGKIIPNPRFPDMKGLADYIHAKGLKAGLYSSPGPLTCGRCVGSYEHEDDDAQQYAEWGFDYLKYDWCSYTEVAKEKTGEVRTNYTLPTLQAPYRVMRMALDGAPRDILFSFCQYGMGNVWEWGAEIGGNSWRTTGDIRDTWGSMSTIGFKQAGHEKYAGPGHFNDPDMLVVGYVDVGRGKNLHPTHLSPNEQYTHISLWCLLDAPLLIGCDMTRLDDFTLNLLENDEVLEVSQDPLGKQAGRVMQNGFLQVWAKDMEDGSKAVGLFNLGREEQSVTAKWSDLGISGKQKVRDLWRQKDLGVFAEKFTATVPYHGVVLVRIWPEK
ncbi:MAG TPA: NPCBM/NEW2 domain-containing protein [Desulfuromonadaceae bacterium]|nr:NPCBM/NEW2 domain-containing protein [Desulfuromonadaceae bacterium]